MNQKIAPASPGIRQVARDAMSGVRPPRYEVYRDEWFRSEIRSRLREGMRILDVGAGRHPSVPVDARAPGTFYVGLDISEEELGLAPLGSYDKTIVADVGDRVPELADGFDLVLCWQVLEHVKPLETAFENMRAYLLPGGEMIAMFSGTFSAFGVLSRVMPFGMSQWLVERVLRRPTGHTFPTKFHRCWYSALQRILRPWSDVSIVPWYTAADYFRFSRPLTWLYMSYEEMVFRRDVRNLAAYYSVIARR